MNYFAYGANLNKTKMRERCPDSKPKFSAVLPNYKLAFVGWSREWRGGVATIIHSNGDKVLGAVYEISERDLKRLDAYEGYPRNYDRREVIVFNEDNEAVKAITYIKAGQLEESKPSQEYLVVIQQGYKDWGLV